MGEIIINKLRPMSEAPVWGYYDTNRVDVILAFYKVDGEPDNYGSLPIYYDTKTKYWLIYNPWVPESWRHKVDIDDLLGWMHEPVYKPEG